MQKKAGVRFMFYFIVNPHARSGQGMDIWKKAEELTEHDYFNVNVLLCYLVKLHIIERWYVLDHEKGAALFKSLVDEVRGTFGGIDMQDYMQTTKRRKTE